MPQLVVSHSECFYLREKDCIGHVFTVEREEVRDVSTLLQSFSPFLSFSGSLVVPHFLSKCILLPIALLRLAGAGADVSAWSSNSMGCRGMLAFL